MYGIEAINAHQGWSIALLGISIVFSGLIILSFSISRIHTVLELWEKRVTYFQKLKDLWQKKDKTAEAIPELILSPDIKESADQFKTLVEWMGEPFALPKLIEFAVKCGLSHPYSAINDLIQSRVIVPDGSGYFIWKPSALENNR